MNPKIISIGEVLWDCFPEREQFGGAPANFACHAAMKGAEVTMLSAVGDDPRGAKALEILGRYRIDTRLVQFMPNAETGIVDVKLDSAGKPTFTIHENSAWDQLGWNAQIEAEVKAADAMYFGTLGQRSDESRRTIQQCAGTARDAGVPRILDINLRAPFYDSKLIRESIELASILKLSDDELPAVLSASEIRCDGDSLETRLQRLRDHYDLEMVVATLGSEGAVLVTADDIFYQSGIPTTVRDTVGAGDSFTAAFLVGLLRNESMEDMLLDACTTAAAVCSHVGAVPDRL